MKRYKRQKIPKRGYVIVAYRKKSKPDSYGTNLYLRLSNKSNWFTISTIERHIQLDGYKSRSIAQTWINHRSTSLQDYNIIIEPWDKYLKVKPSETV